MEAGVEDGRSRGDGLLDFGPVGELALDVVGVEDEGVWGFVAGQLSEGLVEDGLGLEEVHEVNVDEEDVVEADGEQRQGACIAPEGREATRGGEDDQEGQ